MPASRSAAPFAREGECPAPPSRQPARPPLDQQHLRASTALVADHRPRHFAHRASTLKPGRAARVETGTRASRGLSMRVGEPHHATRRRGAFSRPRDDRGRNRPPRLPAAPGTDRASDEESLSEALERWLRGAGEKTLGGLIEVFQGEELRHPLRPPAGRAGAADTNRRRDPRVRGHRRALGPAADRWARRDLAPRAVAQPRAGGR